MNNERLGVSPFAPLGRVIFLGHCSQGGTLGYHRLPLWGNEIQLLPGRGSMATFIASTAPNDLVAPVVGQWPLAAAMVDHEHCRYATEHGGRRGRSRSGG
ncbi:MAG: hypothetical protein EA381_17680 [Planctomycetaceae bacterium]|nr:MAG: hypothetical protein EA381_17680 [Planctomycetaceae bacterium]